MATEQGVVTKWGAHGRSTAWVKTTQSSACESCSSRNSCNPDSSGREREVEAINAVGAKVGDQIQLSMDTSSLLKAAFLLYIFPIICMLIGGLLGQAIGTWFNTQVSLVSVITAMTSFVAAMAIVRIRGGRMAQKDQYRPKITRIISRKPLSDNHFEKPDGCTTTIPSNL